MAGAKDFSDEHAVSRALLLHESAMLTPRLRQVVGAEGDQGNTRAGPFQHLVFDKLMDSVTSNVDPIEASDATRARVTRNRTISQIEPLESKSTAQKKKLKAMNASVDSERLPSEVRVRWNERTANILLNEMNFAIAHIDTCAALRKERLIHWLDSLPPYLTVALDLGKHKKVLNEKHFFARDAKCIHALKNITTKAVEEFERERGARVTLDRCAFPCRCPNKARGWHMGTCKNAGLLPL